MIHPYTKADLERGEKIVQELHGLRGYDAWAERLAKEIAVERERIANRLEEESALSPCKEDGSVYRSAAWLVRADFSYEEAERLEVAAEVGDQQTGPEK